MVETHQQIKDRLLKSASTIWGLKGVQTEQSFDPLVSILFGACASELEKISHDIEDTRGRTLERMVQLLYPEVLSHALPAHAIMYAYPAERFVQLQSDSQFYYQKRFAAISEGFSPTWKNIFFSSTANFDLHQATIKIIATSKNIELVKDGTEKERVCQSSNEKLTNDFQNSIWLGIQNIENLIGNINVYFELKNEADKNLFYDYLPQATWHNEEKLIRTKKYYGDTLSIADKPNPAEIIKGKTNAINKILKHINKFYANRFININIKENISAADNWPADLLKNYTTDDIKKIKTDKLGWIRIDFPENINIQSLQEDLCIGLNCVPVVNRHLIISQQKLTEHINIIPLVSEELFLDVAEITDMQENALDDSINNNTKINLHFGGVERFNEKNAVAAVEGLIQQLRDETVSFAKIGNDFLNNELKSILQSLNKLEQQIDDKDFLKDDTPYLILSNKEKLQSDNIYVKYWTTNGDDANNIKAGTSLSLYKNADVQSNAVMLLTNTVGGRNNLNNRDKVLAYKTALLSKEKLVTEEDISSYCRMRLAFRDAPIAVRKGFMVQENNKGGFIKTVDVHITLSIGEIKALAERGGVAFWQEDLTHAILENSNFFMPLRVFINNKEN